jgi:UV DNA damage repair endonuclease
VSAKGVSTRREVSAYLDEQDIRTYRMASGLAPVIVLHVGGVYGNRKDVLWLHERTGVRVAFDSHHHRCYNPDGRPVGEAAQRRALTRHAPDLAKLLG